MAFSVLAIIIASLFILCYSQGQNIPTVTLHNAARPKTEMPVVGLGTGGYSHARSSQAHPEHWNASEGFINTLKWFSLKGVRWDSALSYPSSPGVAQGLLNATNNWTTTDRKDIFVTSKIGEPLGYNETLQQHARILSMFNTTYIDLLLIHWPSDNSSNSYKSTDKFCNANPTNKEYNASKCRQSTWKALEMIYNNNGANAIGVSNFEVKHLLDIFELDSLKPAVNQFEFHGYWHEYDLVNYCQSYNIRVNSYAPLGTPDVMYGDWNPVLPQHPTAIDIGRKYSKSAAQVWLRWAIQQNVVVNPRSWNISHQRENMKVFDFELNEEEMLTLGSVTPPSDNKVCPDPEYYN